MELPAEYLRGIELFNQEQYFECHEAFESLWLRSEGLEREFLQALTQTAAALHHFQRGNLKGARSIFERARRRLEAVPTMMLNLDVRAFVAEIEKLLALNTLSPSFPPQIRLTIEPY